MSPAQSSPRPSGAERPAGIVERMRAAFAGHPRKRLSHREVLGLFETVCPEVGFAERRGKALQCLAVLRERGELAYSDVRASWDATGAPALPRTVTLVRAKPAQPSYEHVTWVPELAFALDVRRRELLAKLDVLNDWLIANRYRLDVLLPYRERALQIFGDEKAFDGALQDGMLWGRLALTSLGAFEPQHPLPREDFPDAGGPLLIVENLHTWHSLVTWNVGALRYRSIAYGQGLAVTRAVRAVCEAVERSRSTGVQYFGDLDHTGVEIAHTLAQRLAPNVALTPSTDLYDALLEHGVRRASGSPRGLEAPVRQWLGETLANRVQALFETGHWMPQEGLSFELLRTRS